MKRERRGNGWWRIGWLSLGCLVPLPTVALAQVVRYETLTLAETAYLYSGLQVQAIVRLSSVRHLPQVIVVCCVMWLFYRRLTTARPQPVMGIIAYVLSCTLILVLFWPEAAPRFFGGTMMRVQADQVRSLVANRNSMAADDAAGSGLVPPALATVTGAAVPRFFDLLLGVMTSVPLQIGTEVIHVADDHGRTNSLALNAYIHSEMARTLYRAEDKLRAAGYDRPLLVVHSSGGNARVARTVALNTLHSGPAVAIRGAAHLARRLRLNQVVTTDMGGTSLDIAMIRGAAAPFSDEPRVEDIPLSTPMIEVESLGAGGGSIAAVANGRLQVGPRSAGAAPGPACYARGGLEPTVTDANLLLGYIDPEAFMGGRMKLDAALAERAMDRRVAREKGIGVESAALEVREAIDRQMALEIRRRLRAGGYDPARTALFSFGGSGPLHACAVADMLGIARVYAFPYGSVFSAFGSSTTNVRHAYARTLGIPMTQADAADAVLDGFRDQALADMHGEGFEAKAVKTAAEVVVTTGKRFKSLPVRGRRGTIAKALEGERGRIQAVQLSAECEVPHWTPVKATQRASRAPRPLGRRTVRWVAGGRLATQVYARESLKPGHVIRGPAMVDGPDTSYAVAPGWRLSVDDFSNFVMSRADG